MNLIKIMPYKTVSAGTLMMLVGLIMGAGSEMLTGYYIAGLGVAIFLLAVGYSLGVGRPIKNGAYRHYEMHPNYVELTENRLYLVWLAPVSRKEIEAGQAENGSRNWRLYKIHGSIPKSQFVELDYRDGRSILNPIASPTVQEALGAST